MTTQRTYARRVGVLGTKVRVPDPGRVLVQRPRLTELPGQGATSRPRLVLISAPPGFGKTTVLGQYARAAAANGATVAWLSLDEGDNDLKRFLTHLLAALAASDNVGTEAAQLLEAATTTNPEAILTSLVNELEEAATDTLVVLDDYHIIEAAEVHKAVTFLLDHLREAAGLAIATRADPPLQLPRLRARGELLEIRAADLRFTPSETAEFLRHAMDLDLTTDQIEALANCTEGWVAGLQLAGLSLRTASDATAFIEAFTGSHRFVLDYLVDEVLQRQDPHIRRFLLDTATLRELTGPLCDAVTGRGDGAAMLELLDRSNLFVIPLDDRREWYRYHHLFADALRARLTAEAPGRVPTLHLAASEWYAAHDLPEEAIRHALAGRDAERAADLIVHALPDQHQRRQDRVLQTWLEALPDEAIRHRASLATTKAWTRLVAGDFDGVDRWLRAAEAALAEETDPSDELRHVPATIAMYRASAAQARGDVDATIKHARATMALAAPDDHFSRGAGAGFLGMAAWARGNLNEAFDTFSEAVRSLHAAGHLTDELGATVVLASIQLAKGRPDLARQLYEKALEAASRNAGARLSIGADLHTGLAEVLVEQNDLDAADEHLQAARALGDTASLLENRHRWFVVASNLALARGDADAALRLLDEAERLYLPGFFPDVRPIPAQRARIHIAAGNLGEAWDWARRIGVRQTTDPPYLDQFNQATLTQLLLAERKADGSPQAHEAPQGTPSAREPTLGASSAAYGNRKRPTDATALSEREVEVLRLLATSLTGPQIARELYVSVNTLRTHTKHIFTKLDVTNRRAAVERASQLGLL